jgi:hypothetical protein
MEDKTRGKPFDKDKREDCEESAKSDLNNKFVCVTNYPGRAAVRMLLAS